MDETRARELLEGVEVGDKLTPEQQEAQMVLSACGPDCTCGDCP